MEDSGEDMQGISKPIQVPLMVVVAFMSVAITLVFDRVSMATTSGSMVARIDSLEQSRRDNTNWEISVTKSLEDISKTLQRLADHDEEIRHQLKMDGASFEK